MQTPPRDNVWRWTTALVGAVMVAGMPAMYVALTAPNDTQVEQLRARQEQILERLARVEARQDIVILRMDELERLHRPPTP